jgi:bifunctional non-homologous end joining protein LigD
MRLPEARNGCTRSKSDGPRMHTRLDRGRVQLLTRSGLDWTDKYPPIAAALPASEAVWIKQNEVFPSDRTPYSSPSRYACLARSVDTADAMICSDFLHLDGDAISTAPLRERKERFVMQK